MKALPATTALLFVACSAAPGKNSPYNSSGFDTAKDKAAWSDTTASAGTIALVDTLLLTEQNVDVLLDSLQTEHTLTRQRWVLALTRTWPHSDGALSEALSQGGSAYAQEHSSEFIALFGKSEEDLLIWSDLLSGEMIIADVDPFESLGQYMDGMRQLCIGCSESDQAVLDHFEDLLSDRLKEKLQ